MNKFLIIAFIVYANSHTVYGMEKDENPYEGNMKRHPSIERLVKNEKEYEEQRIVNLIVSRTQKKGKVK